MCVAIFSVIVLDLLSYVGNVGATQASPTPRGGSNKYLRGHLFASSSATSASAGVVGASAANTNPANQRPNTSKVRVLSILDKIRSSTQENYHPGSSRQAVTTAQAMQTNNEALIDAISLVEDNGYVRKMFPISYNFGLMSLV